MKDAENLFSESMEKFMKKKGFTYEEKYVYRNWRRACDQRGLPSLQRCKFNYEILDMNSCPGTTRCMTSAF